MSWFQWLLGYSMDDVRTYARYAFYILMVTFVMSLTAFIMVYQMKHQQNVQQTPQSPVILDSENDGQKFTWSWYVWPTVRPKRASQLHRLELLEPSEPLGPAI